MRDKKRTVTCDELVMYLSNKVQNRSLAAHLTPA